MVWYPAAWNGLQRIRHAQWVKLGMEKAFCFLYAKSLKNHCGEQEREEKCELHRDSQARYCMLSFLSNFTGKGSS